VLIFTLVSWIILYLHSPNKMSVIWNHSTSVHEVNRERMRFVLSFVKTQSCMYWIVTAAWRALCTSYQHQSKRQPAVWSQAGCGSACSQITAAISAPTHYLSHRAGQRLQDTCHWSAQLLVHFFALFSNTTEILLLQLCCYSMTVVTCAQMRFILSMVIIFTVWWTCCIYLHA